MTQYVLVVDDSLTIRSSVEFVLKQAGYDVLLATDGVDGIEKLKGVKNGGDDVSVIITDINMPRMDGFTFTKNVKASSFQDTPVLILTTESQPERKEQGRAAGASGWLVKPFQPEQLVEVVGKLAK